MALERIAEREILELLQEGLDCQADRVWFRAGCAPLAVGHGFTRKLAFRQLAAGDVDAIAELVLRQGYVPDSVCDDPADAAHAIPLLCELPGRAILETELSREPEGALVVRVDIARPLEFPSELEFF